MAKERTERLQIDISDHEVTAIENFQFAGRYPTKAAAVRELLRRGLAQPEKESPPTTAGDVLGGDDG